MYALLRSQPPKMHRIFHPSLMGGGRFLFEMLAETSGFKVIIFERDFENFKWMYEKKTAIFLCKK